MGRQQRIPGAVGLRAARAVDSALTQYWQADSGLGLTGTDDVFVVLRVRRDSTANGCYLSLGTDAGTINSSRELIATATTTVSIRETNAAGSTGTSASISLTSGSGWTTLIGAWAGTGAARQHWLRADSATTETAGTLNTTNRAYTTAQSRIRVGYAAAGTNPLNGAVAMVAIYRGAMDADTRDRFYRGESPLTVRPGDLVECWQVDQGGPLFGLVRGTVLTPVGGSTSTLGPVVLQGARRLVDVPGADVFGGTGSTMAASVTGAATTTGDLTTAITGAASVSATATTTAALTTAIEAAASVTATAAVAASLQTRTWIVPSADVGAGTWTPSTGTDLYAMVNDGSDTTYIRSAAGAGPDTCTLAFPAMGVPDAGPVSFVIRHRSV